MAKNRTLHSETATDSGIGSSTVGSRFVSVEKGAYGDIVGLGKVLDMDTHVNSSSASSPEFEWSPHDDLAETASCHSQEKVSRFDVSDEPEIASPEKAKKNHSKQKKRKSAKNQTNEKKIMAKKKTKKSCELKNQSKKKKLTASKKKVSQKRRRTDQTNGRGGSKKQKSDDTESLDSCDLFEKHWKEFERSLTRLEKVDQYGFFWDSVPDEFDEVYCDKTGENKSTYPSHPPYNWKVVRKRRNQGRYVLDREKQFKDDRSSRMAPYYSCLPESERDKVKEKKEREITTAYLKGVHWDLFLRDINGMCDSAVARNPSFGNTGAGTLEHSAKKIQNILKHIYDRTGIQHKLEMQHADDRKQFGTAVDNCENIEAGKQGRWRKNPFPERVYERLSSAVVCSGLSKLDEHIASYELKTNLPDSFVGLSYKYDDTSQSEKWMKSILNETEAKKDVSSKIESDEERQAALALAEDDGVIRAQVAMSMSTLLTAVQDRVMTENGVLYQSELRSANCIPSSSETNPTKSFPELSFESNDSSIGCEQRVDNCEKPEVVEQPVWGIDCYTRRNITICLMTEIDEETAFLYIEKWLLPAINACPADLAHDIANASLLLEGQPFGLDSASDNISKETSECQNGLLSQSLLCKALRNKIKTMGPPWLKAACQLLRKAINSIGSDFFRVHPKGHGSIVLSPKLESNTLVTFYRGEVYASWRWGEKMDAIEITQQRKSLKPTLPDFYNMVLERPQSDPRQYGLLFIDASRKGGHGSSLSHSCDPTCEVRVAALNGKLTLAMTTVRPVEMGEELTFDYHAVTESLNEYRSAICLCGYTKCRGSFLHFAAADCYQKVLNRNSPIAIRFANLAKGCMKRVMAEDDERVLKKHGFSTAIFGAISLNDRDSSGCSKKDEILDSMDIVPVWLRTFVADTLRYIEYERRALPISLICNELSSNDSKQKGSKKSKKEKMKIEKKRDCEDLSKLANRYENDDDTSNVASKLSFETADSEGVSAMEQRIQQLAQTLSRVGRVLYRHRDSVIESGEIQPSLLKSFPRSLREITHSPLTVASDGKVVAWMWNHEHGIVPMLLNAVRRSNCGSPTLKSKIKTTKEKYKFLKDFGDPMTYSTNRYLKLPLSPSEARKKLRVALLEFRGIMVEELAAMSKDRKKARSRLRGVNCRKVIGSKHSFDSTMDNDKEVCSVATRSTVSSCEDASDTESSSMQMSKNNANALNSDSYSIASEQAEETMQAETHADSNIQSCEEKEKSFKDVSHWSDYYNQRYKIQMAADLLLLYANTTTFFIMQPYKTLKSTPIEVYARELGNSVPRAVIDTSIKSIKRATISEQINQINVMDAAVDDDEDDNEDERSIDDMTTPMGGSKKMKGCCQPDDIVAKVAVEYQGDFVLSQLLQWYNGGIGLKPGLPDMLGCVFLPQMSKCWADSERAKTNHDKRTFYELTVRPQLINWLRDPILRGSPWPKEIQKAFTGCDSGEITSDTSLQWLPFGSPVLDLLVTGDDSNMRTILEELGEKMLPVAGKEQNRSVADSLLSATVDQGRPAQAVSNWVQCENPQCLKWRKIPWHVDIDVLSKNFVCSNNRWNPSSNSCDAPEDDWDEEDDIVGGEGAGLDGSAGKMKEENSSIVPEISANALLCKEEEFELNARFNVLRKGKTEFCVGVVIDLDLEGKTKKVKFHFLKIKSKFDEWIEVGSNRITGIRSIVGLEAQKCTPTEKMERESKMPTKPSSGAPICFKDMVFELDARFDVLRTSKKTGKNEFCVGIVVDLDHEREPKRIKFHFLKMKSKFDEWIDVMSDRISVRGSISKTNKKPKLQCERSSTSENIDSSKEMACTRLVDNDGVPKKSNLVKKHGISNLIPSNSNGKIVRSPTAANTDRSKKSVFSSSRSDTEIPKNSNFEKYDASDLVCSSNVGKIVIPKKIKQKQDHDSSSSYFSSTNDNVVHKESKFQLDRRYTDDDSSPSIANGALQIRNDGAQKPKSNRIPRKTATTKPEKETEGIACSDFRTSIKKQISGRQNDSNSCSGDAEKNDLKDVFASYVNRTSRGNSLNKNSVADKRLQNDTRCKDWAHQSRRIVCSSWQSSPLKNTEAKEIRSKSPREKEVELYSLEKDASFQGDSKSTPSRIFNEEECLKNSRDRATSNRATDVNSLQCSPAQKIIEEEYCARSLGDSEGVPCRAFIEKHSLKKSRGSANSHGVTDRSILACSPNRRIFDEDQRAKKSKNAEFRENRHIARGPCPSKSLHFMDDYCPRNSNDTEYSSSKPRNDYRGAKFDNFKQSDTRSPSRLQPSFDGHPSMNRNRITEKSGLNFSDSYEDSQSASISWPPRHPPRDNGSPNMEYRTLFNGNVNYNRGDRHPQELFPCNRSTVPYRDLNNRPRDMIQREFQRNRSNRGNRWEEQSDRYNTNDGFRERNGSRLPQPSYDTERNRHRTENNEKRYNERRLPCSYSDLGRDQDNQR